MTALTAIPWESTTSNDRYEIKITGTPANNHTIQGSFVDNSTEQGNRASSMRACRSTRRCSITRRQPNNLFVTNYSGVLGSRVFVTGQYSQKKFGFRNAGGTSTALADSPFRARGIASGTSSRPALSRAVLLCARSGGPRQQAVRGQRQLFPDDAQHGHA